ncbi:MAG: YbhB/YbcL family Raf kinase inhibitor-like protein [Candidatus Paceibacterota bacterium]
MRNAYALLGLTFLIVFGAAYILFDRAYAPVVDESLTDNTNTTMSLTLTSSAFGHNETIPPQYTCDGVNAPPPLMVSGVPEEAAALVLVMDDPDIPTEIKEAQGIEKFDHYVVYNIPPDVTDLSTGVMAGTPGLNSRGDDSYMGPCPPADYEPTEHRYVFRLYAIKEELMFENTPTLDEVEAAAKEHVIEQAELIGKYERQQ